MKRIQKQMLTAAALVIVGGGAGLYTLYEKVKTPQVRLRELRESQRLFRFGRIHVTKGALRTATATLTFEREADKGFRITDPIVWSANDLAINSMLDHMAGVVLLNVLTEDATDEQLARAGLDRPPVTLSVELEDGRKLTLHIGPKNKLTDRYPVTDADKKRIGLIDTSGYWSYVRPLAEYRAKQVFDVTPREISEVRVSGPRDEAIMTLTKTEDEWFLQHPDGNRERADDGIVDLFLVRVTKNLDVDEYITDAYDEASAAQFGLSPPALRMVVVAGDKRIGAKIGFIEETGSDDATAVAHLEGTRTLLRNTDPTLKGDLTRPPSEFVDRMISRFDTENARRLTLRTAGQPAMRAERTADGPWRIVEPEAHEAKTWKLDAMVRLMSRLRVARWYAPRGDVRQLEEWRLDPWSRRLTIEDDQGRALADVVFGKYADDESIFAKAWTAPRVGVVPDRVVRVLPDQWRVLIR